MCKELKNALNNLNNNNTNNYLKNLTATPETNYSLWKATKKLRNDTITYPPLKRTDGTWARENKEKAEILAKHFWTTFSNDDDGSSGSEVPNITVPITGIRKITRTEIEQCLKNRMNQKKSPGYDLQTTMLLSKLPRIAFCHIRNIYNAIIRLQYFPKVWKVAEIIALPKPCKDATKPSSYRPISLLPTLSKVFERLFCDRLIQILTTTNTIPDHQFGFRKKHSTVQQVHRVTNKIVNDFEQRNFCVAIYLDVAKAFDTVWHAGLLKKLRRIFPLDYWFILSSYITDRHFYVRYKDESSKLYPVRAGVPQGSVLGPLLYSLYTGDIPVPKSDASMIATFADDTVILNSNKCSGIALTQTQDILNDIVKWSDDWHIQINEEKTVQVMYTTRTNYLQNHLKIKNKPLRVEKCSKYLGMYIDSKLLWKDHLKHKQIQMKQTTGQLWWLLRPESSLTLENKLLLYKMIIKPIWTYGAQIWGTASRTNRDKIQRQQNKILRTITNAGWYISNKDIHKDLNVPTVDEEIANISKKHITKLQIHPNNEANTIPLKEITNVRR